MRQGLLLAFQFLVGGVVAGLGRGLRPGVGIALVLRGVVLVHVALPRHRRLTKVRLRLGRPAGLLALLERPVPQGLLVARHAVELAHSTVHLAGILVRRSVFGALQVLHQILQPVEHALRAVHVARLRHVLHLLHHPLQVLRGDRLGSIVGPAILRRALVSHQFGQNLVHLALQGFGELLDLVGRGAPFQRVPQVFLGRPEVTLRLAEIPLLDPQRHLPQVVGEADQVLVGLGAFKPLIGRVKPQVDRFRCWKPVGRDHQPFQREADRLPVVGIENEVLPLLHQCPRQGLGERSGRQDEPDRWRMAQVAAFVPRREHGRRSGAGPGAVRQVSRGLPLAQASGCGWQRQGELGRGHEDAGRNGTVLRGGIAERRLGGDHAVVVADLVAQGEAAARRFLRNTGERNPRRGVGDRRQGHRAKIRSVVGYRQGGVAHQGEPLFDHVGLAGGGLGRRG